MVLLGISNPSFKNPNAFTVICFLMMVFLELLILISRMTAGGAKANVDVENQIEPTNMAKWQMLVDPQCETRRQIFVLAIYSFVLGVESQKLANK